MRAVYSCGAFKPAQRSATKNESLGPKKKARIMSNIKNFPNKVPPADDLSGLHQELDGIIQLSAAALGDMRAPGHFGLTCALERINSDIGQMVEKMKDAEARN
jgi:hypothetical protein